MELLICLHFPNGGNQKKHGGHVTLMWLAVLSSAFDVAVLYLLGQKHHMKHIESSDVLVECA